jgi:hypothetical protein
MDFETAKRFLGFLKKPISQVQLKEFDGLLNEVIIDRLKHVHKPLIRCVHKDKPGEILQLSIDDKGIRGGMADFGKNSEAEAFFGDDYIVEMSLDGKSWFKLNLRSVKL